MTGRPYFVLAAVAAALLIPLGRAADKPNFSGEWELAPGKSDYGSLPAPESASRKIVHHEPEISMIAKQKGARGELEQEFKYATDGKEYSNKSRLGESTSVLKWEGNVLVVTTRRKLRGNDFVVVDRWSLSPDGKTMTVTGKLTGPMGETEYKAVFERI